MIFSKEPRFVITLNGEIRNPDTCFPVGLETHGWIQVNCIGDRWAKFIDPTTNKVHDCADYYKQAMEWQQEN